MYIYIYIAYILMMDDYDISLLGMSKGLVRDHNAFSSCRQKRLVQTSSIFSSTTEGA